MKPGQQTLRPRRCCGPTAPGYSCLMVVTTVCGWAASAPASAPASACTKGDPPSMRRRAHDDMRVANMARVPVQLLRSASSFNRASYGGTCTASAASLRSASVRKRSVAATASIRDGPTCSSLHLSRCTSHVRIKEGSSCHKLSCHVPTEHMAGPDEQAGNCLQAIFAPLRHEQVPPIEHGVARWALWLRLRQRLAVTSHTRWT